MLLLSFLQKKNMCNNSRTTAELLPEVELLNKEETCQPINHLLCQAEKNKSKATRFLQSWVLLMVNALVSGL